MKRISIISLMLVLLLMIVGCETSSQMEIDESKFIVEEIKFENNDISFISSIGDNKQNKNYLYGIEIKSNNDETFVLDSNNGSINDENQYKISFDLTDFPTYLYGSDLLIRPYIINNEEIIYSENIYDFKLILEAVKAKNNNEDSESLNYIVDYANENYKKVYELNDAIYIDDAIYEYNSLNLGKEFLVDWNNIFNTNYESFENFAIDNASENKIYGTSEEIKNHKLYQFFNDNNQEMLVKYQWVFDVITNVNLNLNIIQTQIIILSNKNIKDEVDNKYSSYYGFYQILAQIEGLFTQSKVTSKEYSYSSFDYKDVATYYSIQRVFKNNNIFKYATGSYDYYMIGELYQIDSEVIEHDGKIWKGFSYLSNTYQVGDYLEVLEKNMYLEPKYEYITYSILFFDGETKLDNYSKIYNVASRDVSLPEPEKYGFNFVGWYTSKTFEENTKVDIIKTGSTGDFVLYAKYEPKNYSEVEVVFDLNGGEWNGNYDDTQTFQNPSELPIPQRLGCKFNGWVSDYDNEVYTTYPGYYDFSETIKYTATWEVVNMNDEERIEGTHEELLKFFDENKIISSNLELPLNNDFYVTNMSYESNNMDILTNDGIFKRPYQETNVTYTVTISSNNISKKYSYELIAEGFKELKNIASSYVYSSYDRLTDEFFETMDIIYCAFVLIDVDGGFTGLDGLGHSISQTNKTYLSYMQKYVLPKAHANGVRVVASIGGGGTSVDLAYEEIVKSDAKMDNLAKNIVSLINEYGFDGADLDWEIPNNAKTFSKLSEKVYKAVKANNPNHIVTAAIGAGMWQPPKYDLTVSRNYLDYINLMSYNMVSNGGYHHSALYKSTSYFDSQNQVGRTMNTCTVEESMDIYKSYGVDASQMIIGAAFYGMIQKRTVSNGVYGGWQASGTISYTSIRREYLTSSNYEYYYDTKAEVPYILSKDRTLFISYDDPRSIIAKCDYVKNTGAAGIMYWQNGQDTTGELVRAIKEGFNK